MRVHAAAPRHTRSSRFFYEQHLAGLKPAFPPQMLTSSTGAHSRYLWHSKLIVSFLMILEQEQDMHIDTCKRLESMARQLNWVIAHACTHTIACSLTAMGLIDSCILTLLVRDDDHSFFMCLLSCNSSSEYHFKPCHFVLQRERTLCSLEKYPVGVADKQGYFQRCHTNSVVLYEHASISLCHDLAVWMITTYLK